MADKRMVAYQFVVILVCLTALVRENEALRGNQKDLKQTQQQQQPKHIEESQNNDTQFLMNLTNRNFDWEGGSFPYEDKKYDNEADSSFYKKAVLVAPIVGAIFMISLIFAGVYALRHYDVPECTRGKIDIEVCSTCSKLRKQGFQNKLHNYVMRLFAISANKHEAFFVQMDPRSRMAESGVPSRGTTRSARETLV